MSVENVLNERLSELLELMKNVEVVGALANGNHLHLAKHIGREFCGFNENDEKYIDLFWEPAFNGSWVYLSDEIVVDWMGYKWSKNTVANFTKEMKNKYRDGADYKEVDKGHDLVAKYYEFCSLLITSKDFRGGSNRKYYIVTGEALKKMLIRANTKQGDITCDYFIKVESLGNVTTKLLLKWAEKEKEESDRRATAAERKVNRLHKHNEELLTYKKFIEKKETVYIVSTYDYARQGLFKIGRTKTLIKKRSAGHNTSHASGDRVEVLAAFKVNDSVLVENIIHKKLTSLRPTDNNEFFMGPFALLRDIVQLIVRGDHEQCEQVNRLIDYIAELRSREFAASDWMEGITAEQIAALAALAPVDEIKLTEGEEVLARFDMSKAEEEQKRKFIRGCVREYRRTVLRVEDDVSATVIWRDLHPTIIKKLGGVKSMFKASHWWPMVKPALEEWSNGESEDEAGATNTTILWRGKR